MANAERGSCPLKQGPLPDCVPLAAAFVPIQPEGSPMYDTGEALTRGTLFPGLDLPFLNVVNKSTPYAGTPLGELMALDFVVKELNLYLDTHPEDKEAFTYLQEILKLYAEGKKAYIKRCGPIQVCDLEDAKSYTWIEGPWPWKYTERSGD